MLRDTVRKVGHGAKSTAGSVRHSVHDRAQERRLERTADEAMRLRSENELLRTEVNEARAEHHKILDLLESRLAEPSEVEEEGRKRSHRGRWFLFLVAIGGGAFALMRKRSNGHQEWADMEDRALSGTGASGTGVSAT